MDIDGWLGVIGLAQYAEMFRANDIDIELLGRLTNDDLKDIGVVSFGHRKKLLEAIAELAGAVPASTQPALTEPKVQNSAERRHVTVMFSDLVGSTALSIRMDPEDLREIISAYQKCVAETVRRYGGFVAKYMGDGVLVYFGYPEAHEDDADRAVRAGLELVGAVSALKPNAPLQTRVGIATGLVVVGDLIGSGEAQERGIVGETPNLAARLQAIAEPNRVVIAEATRKLLGNLFELEDLGPKDLKGIAGPVRAWAALRASSAEGRFEAMHASDLTVLVGREEEAELLLRRWSRAKSGEGQVVLLSGEAGIGKSRLTAALLERLATEPHTRLRYFCSPQHTDSAFYPIIGQMERAAGLAHDDTPKARLDRLDAMLAQTSTSIEDAALIAEMLSLPNDGRYPTLDLVPPQRRQRTLEGLTAQLAGLASQQPVLMIFEDVHWIDPTSLEVVNRTVDRVKTLPALLIITFRPEFNAPWVGQSHVTSLTLNRLREREAVAIIAHLVGNKELPADVLAEIVERTDGIPLFVEEMTKAVLEAESEAEARQTAAAVPSRGLAVPASLHASLMARLDRLGSAKEVAQIGAAIGREFSHGLLAAVAHKPETEVGSAINRLIAAGLLFRQGVPPHRTYLFKHALVQDATYGTLLRSARQGLHARIAATLKSKFPTLVESEPQTLARHLSEAGAIEEAATQLQRAATRAAARSANLEAIEHLTKAINLLRRLGDDAPATVEATELALLLQRGPLQMIVKGGASDVVLQTYERTKVLCDKIGTLHDRFIVTFGLWFVLEQRTQFDKACELVAEAKQLADVANDGRLKLQAHHAGWTTDFTTGALDRCSLDATEGLALYRDTDRLFHIQNFLGHDPMVCALVHGAMAATVSGFADRAATLIDRAVRTMAEINHLPTAIIGNFGSGLRSVFERDIERVKPIAANMVRECERIGSIPYLGVFSLIEAWASALNSRDVAAIDRMRDGLAMFEGSRGNLRVSLFRAMIADACHAVGDASAGLAEVDASIVALRCLGEFGWHAYALIVRADLQQLAGAHDEAEASYQEAIGVALTQAAKTWELRAATGLARLWHTQGKRIEARDLLVPTYRWFTEGFDTRDLREAKALLEELQA